MAEVILKNIGDFTADYDDEEVIFSSNEVSTVIVHGITAVKSADKEYWVNGELTYTIKVTNTTGIDLTNIVFKDNLDPTLVALVSDSLRVNGSPAAYTYDLGVLSVNLNSVEEGETVTVTFRVTQV